MCNRYNPPRWDSFYEEFKAQLPTNFPPGPVFPRGRGVFLRQGSELGQRSAVVGQWGLIPWFAKTPKLSYSTNNARSEELASKASFKAPWARGQRCIIPCSEFYEPCWETGRNVWWRFGRSDGRPFGLAGLWSTWTDKESGEIHESYTMLTINADAHPLMSRMHKPDPALPADAQDKRMVVVLEPDAWDAWLTAPVEEARGLMACAPAGVFAAQME